MVRKILFGVVRFRGFKVVIWVVILFVVCAGPHLVNYNVKNESLLIGGEACLWMEYADNEVLMARLW